MVCQFQYLKSIAEPWLAVAVARGHSGWRPVDIADTLDTAASDSGQWAQWTQRTYLIQLPVDTLDITSSGRQWPANSEHSGRSRYNCQRPVDIADTADTAANGQRTVSTADTLDITASGRGQWPANSEHSGHNRYNCQRPVASEQRTQRTHSIDTTASDQVDTADTHDRYNCQWPSGHSGHT